MSWELLENREHLLRLFTAYGSLLTENQRAIVDSYFSFDLSLSEIAEEEGISRAAVSEAIKTATTKMEEFEEKLHLVERRSKISIEGDRISKIKDPVERLNAYEALLKEIENGI